MDKARYFSYNDLNFSLLFFADFVVKLSKKNSVNGEFIGNHAKFAPKKFRIE